VRTCLCLFASLVLGGTAGAQEFQPYEKPRISETEWQTYFIMVQSAHRDSEERIDEQHLLSFVDEERGIQWAFTTLGHPAHPGWIARRLVGEGSQQRIQQVGYYAGSEQDFARWFRSVLDLTRQREAGQR
jgi:hypothetical protein